jgi:hypothetical protein
MIGDSIHGRVDGGETTGAREDSGQPSTGPLAARPACRYRSFRDWGGAEAEYGGPPRLGSDGGRRSPITHVDGHGTAPCLYLYHSTSTHWQWHSGLARCHVMLRCRPAGSGCTPPTTHQRHAAELVRLDTRRQPRALEPAYVVRAVPACAYSCTLRLRTLHLPREFLAQHFSVNINLS